MRIFSGAWKLSVVTPIPKGGDRTLVSNFRPISKQNIMPKVFEDIVASKLSLLCGRAIIVEQHGFVSGQSVITNLLLYHDFISPVIKDGSQVDAIYTDLRKAFDSVNHTLLIHKLGTFGIGGKFLKWLNCFVSGRTQMVKFRVFVWAFFCCVRSPSGFSSWSTTF